MIKIIGTIGVVAVLGFSLAGESNKIDKEHSISQNLNSQAESIRNKQISDATEEALILIRDATGESKACLESLDKGILQNEEPYKKVQLCNIKDFNIEGLYFIKQRLQNS